MFIDAGSKAVTYLDCTRYYLSLDKRDRIIVAEKRTVNTFLTIQRRNGAQVILRAV
jgi:hypothetical protein